MSPDLFNCIPGEFSRVARVLPCQVFGNPPRRAARGGGRWDGAPPPPPRSATREGGSATAK
eukprot:3534860-Pyramimonas_sp.AAC.1